MRFESQQNQDTYGKLSFIFSLFYCYGLTLISALRKGSNSIGRLAVIYGIISSINFIHNKVTHVGKQANRLDHIL
jgi:hypothetical protein